VRSEIKENSRGDPLDKFAPLLLMQGVTKHFPGVLANDNVTLEVQAGEVHALLGENGAGKTTLMNILYGLYQPDAGKIILQGNPVNIRSPRDSIALGIGMVHQHFKLIYRHTVTENVALGLKDLPFWFPTRVVEKELREMSERYNFPVEPRAPLWQLSVGEQQRVEILKTLYRGANILILDEPTSVLTPQESENLFKALYKIKEEGKAVIFITHKLEEVMKIADRVTVMRKGRVVKTLPVAEADKNSLSQMMVGRKVSFQFSKKAVPPKDKEEMLVVKDLYSLSDRNYTALKGVSFTVQSGEILGIAGVSGNGQRELVEVITGLRSAQKGKVMIRGQDLTNYSARRVEKTGVAHIPEDRLRMGIVPEMSVSNNLILRHHYRPPFAEGPFLKIRQIHSFANQVIEEYDILTPSLRTPAKLLSGGNIQKLILARELSSKPHLIVAAHPTYGLDIAATEQIRYLLLQQREGGAAILLVSGDLEEIMALSDRIAVMFEGEIIGLLSASEANPESLGLMMAGEHQEVLRS